MRGCAQSHLAKEFGADLVVEPANPQWMLTTTSPSASPNAEATPTSDIAATS
jgi:hypothetical protein